MFHQTNEELKLKKALFTSLEIQQQPELWEKVFISSQVSKNKSQDFLEEIIGRYASVRVLFTGAGSSAFIGNVIAPIARKYTQWKGLNFESIPTTDIVADPLSYLVKDEPTLIVSFARSGNSPESIAALEIAKKVIKNCFFLTFTCNQSGILARKAAADDTHFLVLMPEASNDKAFAMTSSFSCMLYAASLFFLPERLMNLTFNQGLMKSSADYIKKCELAVQEIERYSFHRVIYLGSACLGALTREAALKCLELNAGKLDTYYESSMGFRHGPKSLLRDETLIIMFGSPDKYTRSYDEDMANEISKEALNSKLVVLCSDKESDQYAGFADQMITVHTEDSKNDNELFRTLVYMLFAQMFALHHSLSLGITPDNPSPDGKVNRVVKGVSIHEFDV